MNPFFIIVRNLLLTVLIEGVLVLVFVRKSETLYHSVLVNMLTNPLVNLFLILWGSFAVLPTVPYYYIATAFLEVVAVITEWVLYYKMGDFALKKAFFASFFLNAASFFFGFLIQ
ncbi:MAG: hypothetical protein IJZ58_09105 [Oscillospiraceae bacterium]|nr:hypothetical protein [Oscillospiraceae bacterium]